MDEFNRVLIVDDDESCATVMRDQLLANDYDVEVFDSSTDALEHLEDEESPTYALLVLDVNLPRIDGITLANRVRKTIGMTTPILFVSSDFSEDRRKTIKRMGPGAKHYVKGSGGEEFANLCSGLIQESAVLSKMGSVDQKLDKLEKKIPDETKLAKIIKAAQNEVCGERQKTCQAGFKKVLFTEAVPEAVAQVLPAAVAAEASPASMLSKFWEQLWGKIILGLLSTILIGYGGWAFYLHEAVVEGEKNLIGVQKDVAHLNTTIQKLDGVPAQIGAIQSTLDRIIAPAPVPAPAPTRVGVLPTPDPGGPTP